MGGGGVRRISSDGDDQRIFLGGVGILDFRIFFGKENFDKRESLSYVESF